MQVNRLHKEANTGNAGEGGGTPARERPQATGLHRSHAACHQGQGKVSVRHVQVEVSTDEEIEQFIIDAELLARLPIVELLRRAAQKYGYVHQGAAAHH
ncbi:hypothetical protein BDA96_01G502100 [Sorghum bicolor]|uniref:Uncharacterized protein n=2 Tax=Sorghum bicolor TaxID=4558 RepID=A0A921V3X1_SORBI|nr:hypothetical protein BDA96_01G502100 [Sorghum bicolor]OQU93072.1 hypothetical protein SORBI_3001G471050 [Sorghum bicolor]